MSSGAVYKNLVLDTAHQGRVVWATLVSVVLHLVGLVGMLWIDRAWFSALTPLNLLLMVASIFWTQSHINRRFLTFIAISFALGFTAESVGVNTGLLFGEYSYGNVLGPRLMGVPLIIGFNWFMVVFAAAASTGLFLESLSQRLGMKGSAQKDALLANGLHVITAAGLATAFDWVMEPVAVKLGFWTWSGGIGIPMTNYLCWFALSAVLGLVMKFLRIDSRNLFAANLFLVQLMFFAVLRLLL